MISLQINLFQGMEASTPRLVLTFPSLANQRIQLSGGYRFRR